MAPTTTAEEIEEFFNKHCEVTEVVLKNGFAFVNTSSINEATNAMNTLQGSDFMGSPLTINYAKDYSQKVSLCLFHSVYSLTLFSLTPPSLRFPILNVDSFSFIYPLYMYIHIFVLLTRFFFFSFFSLFFFLIHI